MDDQMYRIKIFNLNDVIYLRLKRRDVEDDHIVRDTFIRDETNQQIFDN